ncbi:MAG: acyl-CoA thioesterase [Pseudobdellovibrionaceae bacterium]
MAFEYSRRSHFYETDLMGIVHHSNYLRFLEEARVAWLRERKIDHLHGPDAGCYFAVLSTEVKHLKPVYFEEVFKVELETRLEGVVMTFQYRLTTSRYTEPCLVAKTTHVPVNNEMKVLKLNKNIREVFKREKWTETWL